MPHLPIAPTSFACPYCDDAKIQKKKGGKTSQRETHIPGTSFHMDLAFIHGPQEPQAKGKKRGTTVMKDRQGHTAYLIIICAATRYIWTFPLKSKHPPIAIIDAFLDRHGNAQNRLSTKTVKKISTSPQGILSKSKSFATLMTLKQYQLVEQPLDPVFDQTPLPSGQYTIRTDNGGELAKSQGIQETIFNHGYNLETTAPGTSNQNGLAERTNKTLKERVRCLLYTASLGAEFWADALLHAVWLYNRTYHRWLGRTPFEAYTGRKPLVDKLITFGAQYRVLHSFWNH